MAEGERRLGRGLDALLGDYMAAAEEGSERRIPVSAIRPNPFQPRRRVGRDGLAELMESIRENGLLQPLVVRPAGDEGWEIVAGERRWRCLVELGWEKAPAVVRELSDRQMLVLALVENLQREDLSPVEEAAAYRRLIEEFELTQGEVAERVGRDRSTVANTLRLLSLPEEVQEMLAEGGLTAGHGRAILAVEGEERRRSLAREVVEKDLSVRATERRARRMVRERDREEADASGDGPGRGEREGAAAAAAVARRAERALERALGTQVQVSSSRKADGGRIAIVYHDPEEFERIVRLLAGDEAEDLFGGP